MKNLSFNKSQAFYQVKNWLYDYRYYCLMCLIAIISGGVLGVLTILNTSVEISVESLTDVYLLDFLKNDASWITFLFYSIIECVFTLGIIFVTIYSVFLVPITLFIVLYKAYNYFINITILILCLNVFGVFNTIVIIIPSYILTLVIFSIFACIIMKMAFDFKYNGTICVNEKLRNSLIRMVVCLLVVKVFVILFEVIMLSIFSNKFIIS